MGEYKFNAAQYHSKKNVWFKLRKLWNTNILKIVVPIIHIQPIKKEAMYSNQTKKWDDVNVDYKKKTSSVWLYMLSHFCLSSYEF